MRLKAALLSTCLIACLAAAAPASAAPRTDVAPAVSTTPHLLLIHGGSFIHADPSFPLLTETTAIEAGFIPHYLEYPLGDLRAAVTAARRAAVELRRRFGPAVYAYGSSAGGTLAAILAGDGLVAAAVAKAPPSDLPTWSWPLTTFGPDYPELIDAGEPTLRRFSPYRRPARRPLFIIHGREDAIVPEPMSAAFAAKFKRVHLWAVPGGHWTERIRPWILPQAFDWLRARSPVIGRS